MALGVVWSAGGNEYTDGDLLYVEPLFVLVGLQRRLSLGLILSSSGLGWGRTWAGPALHLSFNTRSAVTPLRWADPIILMHVMRGVDVARSPNDTS